PLCSGAAAFGRPAQPAAQPFCRPVLFARWCTFGLSIESTPVEARWQVAVTSLRVRAASVAGQAPQRKESNMRSLPVICTVVSLALALGGSTASAVAMPVRPSDFAPVVVPRGQPVQIAFADSLTGSTALYGPSLEHAVQMAVESHPTIHGVPIQVNVVDAPCGDPAADVAAAEAIAANAQNVAVLGQVCSAGFDQALQVYEAAGLVTISGSATNDALPAYGPNVFDRTAVDDGDGFEAWYATVSQLPADVARRKAYTVEFGPAPSPFADRYYAAAG